MIRAIRYLSPLNYSLILIVPILLPIKAFALGAGVFYLGEEVVRKDKYIINGDACQVLNPSSQVAQKLRRTNGSLKNTHEDRQATVFCPISQLLSPDSQSVGSILQYKLQVAFFNSNDHSQEYFCEVSLTPPLAPKYPFSIGIGGPSSIRKTLTIDAEDDGWITFNSSSSALTAIVFDMGTEDLAIDDLSRPVLQCALPPRSEIRWMVIEQQIRLIHFGTP